jgi:hypothetical protein
MKRALLILFTLALSIGYQVTWAQVPSTLSYQGVLHDGTGGAVRDSTYDITFKIYEVSTGEPALWTELQAVDVQGGIFSVILGKTTPLALAFDKPYWLGVTVEGSAEFSPRRELTAAAYSMNTKSIEVGAVTESALADSSVASSKLAGGTVVRSLNTLTDDVTLAPGANVSITASGDTLTIGATSVGDNDWTVAGDDMYSTVSGNVGIGTASPLVKLDVGGDINTDSDYKMSGATVLSTSGTDNVFVGVGAGTNNTGSYGTFVGYNTGYNNEGYRNTFVGENAGRSNTTGNGNTFLGRHAGFTNTTSGANTFVGSSAGFLNSAGHSNTFVGYLAGNSNTTGFSNTFVGLQAGHFNNTGYSNTLVGRDAGHANTTGFSNTFLGYYAGNSNTTGGRNTFVGSDAGFSNTTGSSNTFLGDVAGYSNTAGFSNTFLGHRAGFSNTTGNTNVFIGYEAGYNETGSNKLFISNGRDDTDVLIYGDFSTDRVGILTVSPGYTLDVAGPAHASSFPVSSDERLKKNVEPLGSVLEKLEMIRGVSFEWNELYESLGRSTGHKEIGVIAQEVEAVFPELVTSWGDESYKAVDYGRLTGVLIEAVKELKAENAALKKRVEALERTAD